MSAEDVDPRSLSVGVGFPCGPSVPYQTTLSLAATAKYCTALGIPFQVHAIAGSSQVTTARNAVLTKFLAGTASRLFWVDSDIAWAPEDFLRLVQLTEHVDIVAGAYPLKRDDVALVINGAQHPLTTHELGLVRVDGLGLGFTCVRREALEALVATKQRKVNKIAGEELVLAFRETDDAGEDVNFFADMRALGYDVWLDPTVKLGHVGVKLYECDVAEALGLQTDQE